MRLVCIGPSRREVADVAGVLFEPILLLLDGLELRHLLLDGIALLLVLLAREVAPCIELLEACEAFLQPPALLLPSLSVVSVLGGEREQMLLPVAGHLECGEVRDELVLVDVEE